MTTFVTQGYLNNPEATKNTFASDGWFKSGDVGVMDAQGNLYIVDRLKELIKYKVSDFSQILMIA